MARWFKPFVAFFLLIYMVVQVLSLNYREKKHLASVERLIIFLAAPAQNALWGSVNWVVSGWQHYIGLTQTSKLNEKIQAEKSTLARRVTELHGVELENERLRALLGLKEREKFKMEAGERIAVGASVFERTIRVKLKDSSAITVGMAVLHPGGVVGQVYEVFPETCDVLLLTDLNSAIDGIIERSRVRGILKGTGTSDLKLEYISSKDDVQVGDEIVTSGLDGVYPKGIPIGSVLRVESGGKGLFLSAWVKPRVDFSRIEEVGVVLK